MRQIVDSRQARMRRIGQITAVLAVLVVGGAHARADEIVAKPACMGSCALTDIYGNEVLLPSGGVAASPINSTYSFTHMLGGDIRGDGTTTCLFIAADPTPPGGAIDDIVLFDGVAEATRTDIDGTMPIVIESLQDFGGGTRTIFVRTWSETASDLFPGGHTTPDNVTPLTDACVFVGLFDALDWEGLGNVTAASMSFYSGQVLVAGPVDLSGLQFPEPWDGRILASFSGLAGQDITRTELTITVEKTALDELGACCLEGQCVGDTEQESCEFQGGVWNVDASCGADPTLPTPICSQTVCAYDNGAPLDDEGAVLSRFAPDAGTAAGAVDDFVLHDSGNNSCRITGLRVWTTHLDNRAGEINPDTHYEGINVTIYADDASPAPLGRPTQDGEHRPDVPGGVVYSRLITMDNVVASFRGVSCVPDAWRLDIPIDVILSKHTRYWLEVQPIMDASLGGVYVMLSQNNNEYPAQEIDEPGLIFDWREVAGNANACPGGGSPTPSAGTRRNLAFRLTGEKRATAFNDACASPLPLVDGVTPFSTIGATTDGPPEPELCEESLFDQIYADIWYQYRATCTGTSTISLCGSEYDTKIAVYPGCDRCPVQSPPVVCNDSFCADQSQVEFAVDQGLCYTVRVGGFFNEQGAGVITARCEEPPGACCNADACLATTIESDCDLLGGTWFAGGDCGTFICPVDPPPHDECSNCIWLETGVEYIGTNVGAGGTDISSCSTDDENDVWHCWRADCTGAAVISLCSPALGFDTTLAAYDGCDGQELACNDDSCPEFKSLLAPGVIGGDEFSVVAGQTYYIRVAGYRNDDGEYRITVEPCGGACCDSIGCRVRSRRSCLSRGGLPYAPGSECLGDLNGNQVDDICETCPPGAIVEATPIDNLVDARQPYEPDNDTIRQGIGSSEEPIVVKLDAPLRGVEDCFNLCETAVDPVLGPNAISQVTQVDGLHYRIELDHPITPGAVSTIEFVGGDSFVRYTAHPGNVNTVDGATTQDVLGMMQCCLNGNCDPQWDHYRCDVDRSGDVSPHDMLRVIDLLNGAGLYNAWLDTPLPVLDGCP